MVIQTKGHDDTSQLTLHQMDLTHTYRIFHPIATEYTFSAAHQTLSKIYYILVYKASHNNATELKNFLCFSDHYEIILEINSKRNFRKYATACRLNNIHLNNH
jgi:hypothetical protein